MTDKDFWLSVWRENQLGFHQSGINPYLQKFWGQMQLAPGGEVLVPLCGKSRDMVWLREQGHRVVGVELSEIAVADFFAENGLQPQCTEEGAFTVWEAAGISIYCGDVLALPATVTDSIDAVYDRAALVALPAAVRARYVAHLSGLLLQGTRILLLTIDYPQAEMHGPPYAVSVEEVYTLYGNNFGIEPLASEDILAASPRFQRQGLSRFVRGVYVLERLP